MVPSFITKYYYVRKSLIIPTTSIKVIFMLGDKFYPKLSCVGYNSHEMLLP